MTLQKIVEPMGGALLTKEGLDTAAAQLRLLEEYVKGVLHDGQDYGVIPGTGSKPTLLKPGAANVIAAFNCYPDPHIETETINLTEGLVFYRVRVDVLRMDNGLRRATGQGSCSSYEKKYRYRNAQPICPECGKENIRVSRGGGGFYCWQKLGGCGTNFPGNDDRITTQEIGQVINKDPMELANTILKMAVKRAEVDAALRLPGVARFFTQDLEDMHPDTSTESPGEIALPAAPPTPTRPPKPTPQQPGAPALTVAQLRAAIEAEGMPWGNFETIVLRTTWATFIKREGATPAVALHQWETWKKAHPGGVPAVAAAPATGRAKENATEPAEGP